MSIYRVSVVSTTRPPPLKKLNRTPPAFFLGHFQKLLLQLLEKKSNTFIRLYHNLISHQHSNELCNYNHHREIFGNGAIKTVAGGTRYCQPYQNLSHEHYQKNCNRNTLVLIFRDNCIHLYYSCYWRLQHDRLYNHPINSSYTSSTLVLHNGNPTKK